MGAYAPNIYICYIYCYVRFPLEEVCHLSNESNNSVFDEGDQVENKLLLLYLIDRMNTPMTNSQISQFTLEENFMSYFELQHVLFEMVQSGYLEIYQENNQSYYSITNEGITTLEYFEKHVPVHIRNRIVKFVTDNQHNEQKNFDVTANYFFDHTSNEFIVKCGLYEKEKSLMEISLLVVSRDQAKLICNNWKTNVNKIFGKIISELITTD